MRPALSCTAAFGLLERGILIYIHFNDEASSKS
jgi:hypothetical protein